VSSTTFGRRMAAVAALVGGVFIGVTVLSGTAWAPPSGPLKVAEQNLDASGNIKVHEQGTAKVNVNNLPLDPGGAVRVSDEAAGRGRVIQIVSDPVAIEPGGFFQTDFEESADCRSLAAFWEEGGGGLLLSLVPRLVLSPDGVYDAGSRLGILHGPSAYFPAFGPDSFPIVTPYTSMPAVTPFAAIEFENTNASEATLTRAWLYCSR